MVHFPGYVDVFLLHHLCPGVMEEAATKLELASTLTPSPVVERVNEDSVYGNYSKIFF